MPDGTTLAAVALTLTFASAGLGRPLPLNDSTGLALLTSLLLLWGYLYLCRTLLRLPFALVITFRRARHARRQYQLNRWESVQDGVIRGFLDTRRWSVGPLALVDRLGVCGFTLLATTPGLGNLLLQLGGLIGILLLLLLYAFRGSFALLVEDHLDQPGRAERPFFNLRD